MDQVWLYAQTSGRNRGPRTVADTMMSDVQHTTIEDHEGNTVEIIWNPRGQDKKLPPFPFQLYIVGDARPLADDPGFPASFASYVERLGGVCNERGVFPRCRFEVYRRPFRSVLGCISHNRREVDHRNRNGIWPRLLNSWTTTSSLGDKGKIVVLDSLDWSTSGITVVEFDPAEYDHPQSFSNWDTVAGDYDPVRATRYPASEVIRYHLGEWWGIAGSSWTEADLQRRNEGGSSPALYPAQDPELHRDLNEAQNLGEIDIVSQHHARGRTPSELAERHAEDEIIVDSFNKADLFQCAADLEQWQCASFSDCFGLPVESVWDSKLSKDRPQFAFTLYIAYDVPYLDQRALFDCLNKGLVQEEVWALDLVRNLPSIEAAFEYHARAIRKRSSERTHEAQACMEVILNKVTGHALPLELRDYIKKLLVPPPLPTFNCKTIRPFENIFMYLDAKSLDTGPLVVYSAPSDCSPSTEKVFWNSRDTRYSPLREPVSVGTPLLRVANLRFWNRVSDELHILWNLHNPHPALAPADVPRIILRLRTPERDPERSRFAISERFRFEVDLRSKEPIVFRDRHAQHIGFDVPWTHAFEIVDESGNVLPHPARWDLKDDRRISRLCQHSWAQQGGLGLHRGAQVLREQPHEVARQMTTFWPSSRDQPVVRIPTPEGWVYPRERHVECHWGSWQSEQYHQAAKGRQVFVPGRSYTLRLKPGTTIERWSFGTYDNVKRPYNFLPIPV